ncbi:MAG: zinc-dependent alcohol dehydrogenase family protein [Lautropia sp.]
MQFEEVGKPLRPVWHDELPTPGAGQVRIAVSACGVCRTDLHLVDGDLKHPGHPIVPGHEIVGRITRLGAGVAGFALGDRVGVPWLGWTCGRCEHCRAGRENLCEQARFTGWQIDGGYAEQAVADARFVFRLPARYGDEQAAPLLCAGLIGYRAYAMAGLARDEASGRESLENADAVPGRRPPRVGLYGFGAAAHLIAQVAVHQGREVFAFTRRGDDDARQLALDLGAVWAGPSDAPAPLPLDAALLFAPDGALVPGALRDVRPGGIVVCAGIHMSDIPGFPYARLWGERRIVSVANLTRADGDAFMRVADAVALQVRTRRYPLADADRALDDLRAGRISGAAVLACASSCDAC